MASVAIRHHLSIERGKVTSYWFALGDDDFEEPGRTAVRDAVPAKYGELEPVPKTAVGCEEETFLVHKAKPRISLNWDKISKQVAVS